MRRNRQTERRSGTVNRGWLKRQIQKGKVEARRLYHYSDDYALDAAMDYGKTDWLPAAVLTQEERISGYFPEGKLKFDESDFRGFGRA